MNATPIGLRQNLINLGYTTGETNMQTCGGLGTDYDGPDCLADYWFNGNLGAAASADILMFKSCFHLVTLNPTDTDLERWKTKYLNRFIYGTGGSNCSGTSCNGYAKNNPNQLIIAMPSIPFNLNYYGRIGSTLPASDVVERWGEWLKRDFVNIARTKGINNIISFDIFDYFADDKSDNGNNLQCPEYNLDSDSHLDNTANSCAAGNSGAPSLLHFIDTYANDFFRDTGKKSVDSFTPDSYRCTGSCPALIYAPQLPTATAVPIITTTRTPLLSSTPTPTSMPACDDTTAPPVPPFAVSCNQQTGLVNVNIAPVSDNGCAGLHQYPYWAQVSTINDFSSVITGWLSHNRWQNGTAFTSDGQYPLTDGQAVYARVRSRDAQNNQSVWSETSFALCPNLATPTPTRIPTATLIPLPTDTVNPQLSDQSIPWGAMYAPFDQMPGYGLNGTVTVVLGNAQAVLAALQSARNNKVSIILTIGSVDECRHMTNNIYQIEQAKKDYDTILTTYVKSQLRDYYLDGTLKGIRLYDEVSYCGGSDSCGNQCTAYKYNLSACDQTNGLLRYRSDIASLPIGNDASPGFADLIYYLQTSNGGLPHGLPIGSTAAYDYMVKVADRINQLRSPGNPLPPRSILAAHSFQGYDNQNVSNYLSCLSTNFRNNPRYDVLYFLIYPSCQYQPDNTRFFSDYIKICESRLFDFINSWSWSNGQTGTFSQRINSLRNGQVSGITMFNLQNACNTSRESIEIPSITPSFSASSPTPTQTVISFPTDIVNSEITSVPAASPTDTATPTVDSISSLSSGLIARYQFNEISWNGTNGEVKDSSGNGNNGKAINGAYTTPETNDASNRFGVFDGINDYVKINPSNSLIFPDNSPFTISAWFKTSASNGDVNRGIITRKAAWNTIRGWSISLINSTAWINASICDGLSCSTLSSSTSGYNNNLWHHVVLVYNGSQGSLYIDGTKTSTVNTGFKDNTTTSIIIGAKNGRPEYFHKGQLDDVRIYNRALTSQEIQSLSSRVLGTSVSQPDIIHKILDIFFPKRNDSEIPLS